MALVNSFTTFFGTRLLGMWCTWGNDAGSRTATVSATTNLNVDIELNLYAAGWDTTATTGKLDPATASRPFKYYI